MKTTDGDISVSRYRVTLVRESHSTLYGAPRVMHSEDIAKLLGPHFSGLPHEEFVTVFLDAKNAPIGYQVVSVGSLTLSIVHPREVFKGALLANAAAVVFAHNHPSADPTPSAEDRMLTTRLKECGELLGIRVLDHVVMGETRNYSFADQGTL